MMFTPDQVDPPLRGVRRAGRIARRAGRGRGHRGGDASRRNRTDVRRRGAVRAWRCRSPASTAGGTSRTSVCRGRISSRSGTSASPRSCSALSVLALLVAAWFHFSGRDRSPPDGAPRGWRGSLQSPLAIAAWLLVMFEVLSLTLGVTDQYPAWSVGRSNLEALTGKTLRPRQRRDGRTEPQRRHADARGAPVGDALGAVDLGRLLPQRDSRQRLRRPGDGERPGLDNFADSDAAAR